MKTPIICLILFFPVLSFAQDSIEEANKTTMLKFYHDLWGSNNTDRYSETVADTYIVHDIGDRKNVQEPAIRQKEIADQFWENGELEFILDYQVAEGDMVVTRWHAKYKPSTLKGSLMYGDNSLAIINVARLKDGKIVELWNHRHDIDSNQTFKYTIKGFLMGAMLSLIPLFILIRSRKSAQTE